MNKFIFAAFLCVVPVCAPVGVWAQTLQDVAEKQPEPVPTIDSVIEGVVNDTSAEDDTVLGEAPPAEVAAVEEAPAAELQDDPMEPQKFATLGTLDKVTGRTSTLDVPVDKVVAVGPLFLQVKACQKASAFANQPENAAFVQVWQSDNAAQKDQTSWVFSGWMFASSPSLSAIDHPVYDVWVIACKNMLKNPTPAVDVAKPNVAEEKAPAAKTADDLSAQD